MEEEIEDVNSTTDSENENSTNDDFDKEVDSSVDVLELQKKNQSLYEQLRKAQGFTRDENGKWTKKESKPEVKAEVKPERVEVSQRDTIALIKADVAEEDISYVEKWAKMENISVADALKDKSLVEILSVKKEQRKTAEVTNVAPVRRGPQKLTDEALLEKARNNEEVDLEAVAKARMEEKKAKIKK